MKKLFVLLAVFILASGVGACAKTVAGGSSEPTGYAPESTGGETAETDTEPERETQEPTAAPAEVSTEMAETDTESEQETPEPTAAPIEVSTETAGTDTEPEQETPEPTTAPTEVSMETAAQAAKEPYLYEVEELGIQLKVPDELFVYRIDGIYLDWSGELNSHEFSEWIVVTDQEYEEGALTEKLIENPHEEAEHIFFCVSFTPAELMPARRLCYGLFGNGRVRVIDDGYCEIFNVRSILALDGGWPNAYKHLDTEPGSARAKLRSRTLIWENQILVDRFPPMELGALVSYLVLNPAPFSETPYHSTMVNEDWWRLYCRALEELTHSGDQYAYDAAVTDELARMSTDLYESSKEYDSTYRSVKLTSVHTDSAEDIYLRAYCYANLNINAQTEKTPLNDIIIILHEWENGQRSFEAYRVIDSPEGSEYDKVSAGHDYVVDLQPSYDYIQAHMGGS